MVIRYNSVKSCNGHSPEQAALELYFILQKELFGTHGNPISSITGLPTLERGVSSVASFGDNGICSRSKTVYVTIGIPNDANGYTLLEVLADSANKVVVANVWQDLTKRQAEILSVNLSLR